MQSKKLNQNWIITEDGVTKSVTIPHDYMIGAKRCPESPVGADGGFFMPGRATYEVHFTADQKMHHFIQFDGVMGYSEVYVNGNLVKNHHNGYTSFICDADDYIQQGENANLIRVDVDNMMQPNSRWYTGAGIYREVSLLTSDADYIVPNGIFTNTLSIHEKDTYILVETTIFSNQAQTADLTLQFTYQDKIVEECLRHIWLEQGENTIPIKTTLHNIKKWSVETPELYSVNTILVTNACTDKATVTFGIRTVECDSEKGLLLNGEPIKMYGACIHHDNGIIGAASFYAAEERRIRILKENGFNAIRTSHNPPSTAFLEVCDRLGMLVIDEMFDAWLIGKRTYDYHIHFEKDFRDDIASAICRDRNHPSVIMWSTGNEIPEKNGVSHGYRTGYEIIKAIRALDNARPITHALCTFWDNQEYAKKDMETVHDTSLKYDFFTEKTMYTADILDVSGYNYLLDRLDKDFKTFPDRIVAMTESYPMDVVPVKRAMNPNNRFIGEFVWTGWDYFGETGIGHTTPGEGRFGGWGLTDYPEHIANCGDFDICGFKKPQSYLRDAAWNEGSVHILTSNPLDFGKLYDISSWGFYRTERTWNYNCTEDAKTLVHLYTMADECELIQDGVSLGKKNPDFRGMAEFTVTYRPGKLEAIAYVNGVESGRDILESEKKPSGLFIKVPNQEENLYHDLILTEISLCDCEGNNLFSSEDIICVTAQNADVIGTGNGNISSEHNYTSNTCETYHGHILAALLPHSESDTIMVYATGTSGLSSELIVRY